MNILVVENDPLHLKLVRDVLNSAGQHVAEALATSKLHRSNSFSAITAARI